MAVLVNSGFETGDFSGWTGHTGGGDCTVTSAAAMAGTNLGMASLVDDGTGDYAYLSSLNNVSGKIRARFYFNFNTFLCAAGMATGIFALINTAADLLLIMRVEESGGKYYFSIRMYKDDTTSTTIRYSAEITAVPHWIEINAWKSSGANDGGFDWWVDGEQFTGESTVDNDTRWAQVNTIDVGPGAGGVINIGTAGTAYTDQVTINDDGGEIGPYANSAKGAYLYGYNIPASGETALTWKKFDDGAAGAVTVSGDEDWGKLQLIAGAEGRSNVIDLGEAVPRTFTITENVYGSGQGDADLEIRGDTSTFAQDDASPSWTAYTTPTLQTWRYVQIRESRE